MSISIYPRHHHNNNNVVSHSRGCDERAPLWERAAYARIGLYRSLIKLPYWFKLSNHHISHSSPVSPVQPS